MQFITKFKDCNAKIGQFSINKKSVITPNIFYTNSTRFSAPYFADILLSYDDKTINKPVIKAQKNNLEDKKDFYKYKKKDLIIIKYASQIYQHPLKFVNTIIDIRRKIDYNYALYIPAICRPANLSLLIYMGIDFVDSIYSIIAARNNVLLFSDGEYLLDDLTELPCNCEICCKVKNNRDMSFKKILQHNYYVLFNELKLVRNMIKKSNLRSLVEKRVKSDPILTSILRNLDMHHFPFFEEKTPVTSSNIIYANTKESMSRPEIKRFQIRVIKRYKKPVSAKICVMLPCSLKKPYSFSESHRCFIERIQTTVNPNVVHELIITSPLGIVPRELELTYPASNYDIPVTGIWDEDEKNMIKNQLVDYLKNNNYDAIIMHLPKEIIKFTKDLIKNPIVTCIDSPLSNESLEKLTSVLKKETCKYEKIPNQTRNLENIRSLLLYQYGLKPTKFLMKKSLIKGRYPFYKIISEKNQIGMLIKQRGLISLTFQGAKRLYKSKEYWVEIYDDFELIGSVFAPGVKNADIKIRKGDDVVIIKDKKLTGVGVAQMNGQEMMHLNYGEAIKVRHRV